MKKVPLFFVTILMTFVCIRAMAYTVELDPADPLTDYISLGEWNTDGNFENWTHNDQIANLAVYDGSLTGLVSGGDMNITLNMTSLPTPRSGNIVTTGSIYEVRLRFDPFTVNENIDLFTTMDGIFMIPALRLAKNDDDNLPDVPIDGEFHVYRLTFDENDTYMGRLDALRFDILSGSIDETFDVDYFRIANVITNVPHVNPLTVDGEPLPYYTSLAEWDTDDDLESWFLANITNETVSGGILSAQPFTDDPFFYKRGSMGLPEVDLADSSYVEFRLKQSASVENSLIQLFFGTVDNPNYAASRKINIPSEEIPKDGEFHIYRYQMSQHPDWKGYLETFRIDPYTVDTTEMFEIDYVRVGDLVPEPALFLGIVLAGIAFFRRRF